MNRVSVGSISLALSALTIVLPVVASAQRSNDSGLSCKQIVAMGFTKFLKQYVGKSETPERDRNACAIFVKCQRDANLVSIKRLVALEQSTVRKIEGALKSLDSGRAAIPYALNGGGSIYSLVGWIAEAEREELLGKVIACFSKPTRTSQSRQRASLGVTKLSKVLHSLKKKDTSGVEPTLLPILKRGITDLDVGLKAIDGPLKLSPDNAAGEIGAHLKGISESILN